MKKIGRIFGGVLLCLILFSCSNLLEKLEHAAIPLHTVSYESERGTAPTSVGVLDNTALTQEHLPLLLAVGYTFEGWYCEDTKIEVGYVLHDSITLTAKWSTNTDTPYKVEHYQQNIADDEYTLFETEEKSGTTGAQTQATAKEYTGFVAKAIEQRTILADGSAEVKVYYDRKKYTVTFNPDGGILTDNAIQTVKYGDNLSKPNNPIQDGFFFEGWFSSDDNGIITSLFPWNFKNSSPKKILVICNENCVDEALNAGAFYAGSTEYIEKIKEGWLDFDIVIATPDMMKDVGRLGMILGKKNLMPNPKKGTVTNNITAAIKEINKTCIVTNNLCLTAKWQKNTLGIKVQAPSYSDIPNLATPTISGTTVTFVAPEEYARYSWYIDGVLQDNEHTQSFILDTTNLSARSYYIMLVVVDEKDAVYSAQYELEVTK